MIYFANNHQWEIVFEEPDSPFLFKDCAKLGMCNYLTNKVYIVNNLTIQRLENVLRHEVAHSFIESTGMYSLDAFNHEQVCEFVAMNGAYIEKVVQDFMRVVESENIYDRPLVPHKPISVKLTENPKKEVFNAVR